MIENIYQKGSRKPFTYKQSFYEELPLPLVFSYKFKQVYVKLTALLVTYFTHICPNPENLNSTITYTEDLVTTYKSCRHNLSKRTIKNMKLSEWLEFNQTCPYDLWTKTVQEFRHKNSGNNIIGYKHLLADPLIIFTSDPIHFRNPDHLTFLTSILSSLLKASSSDFFVKLELLDESGKKGVYRQAEVTSKTLTLTQTVGCCQLLIEGCLEDGMDSECAKIAARFLHDQIILDPHILQLLVWQGFPLKCLPSFVYLVDSSHVAVEYLTDSLRSH